MQMKTVWMLTFAIISFCVVFQIPADEIVYSQGRGATTPEVIAKRNATENELQSIAIVERKLMVPMRDGKRMATDVYRPKDTLKKYPTIFVRTPYNFNFWDVRDGAPRDLTNELEAVKRGYAYVEINERGHFFPKETTTSLDLPSPMATTN